MASGPPKSMKTVRLNDPRTLPERLLKRLAPYEPLIRRSGFVEHLFEDHGFNSFAIEVDEYIANSLVRAHHCTKELRRETFRRRGLRLLVSKRHTAEFMRYISGTRNRRVRKTRGSFPSGGMQGLLRHERTAA